MNRPDRTSRAQQPDRLRWFAGLPCLVAALVVAVVFAVSWSNLPDPMAVHFDEGGGSNRSASPVELLLVSELTLLIFGVGLSRGAVRRSLALRSLCAASAAAAVSLGYLFSAAVLVNADAGTADEARMPLWHLPVAAGLAVAAAVGVQVLMPRERPAGTDQSAASGSVGLRRGEKAVWVRSVGPRWLMAAGALGAVVAVAAGVLGWGPGFWLWPVALLFAVMAGARVSVDGGGLTIRPPLLHVPRIHIPLQRIERAWAAEVRPLPDLGGWGYRIVKGRRGLALRSGQAVWLELEDGKQFVVAVDDAATAAGLLGDLLARDARRDR
ncbi:DUF1648 domain-containing protein [Streptomyces phaeochromogenes]|uniref:DUF1648 domain-containing protein n=1 Tax=Streptomyces phaeochromogenes TaxID=1923 RepID=UPI002E2B7E0E|nr:DUF1648 domain-containing protein [Streptomyces phaeochromogenes]